MSYGDYICEDCGTVFDYEPYYCENCGETLCGDCDSVCDQCKTKQK